MRYSIKTIIAAFVLFLPLLSSAGTEVKELGKSLPSFMITERKTDKSLKKGESKFEFKFKDEKGIHSGTIQIGMNDSSFTKSTSMTGIITEKTKAGYYKLYFYAKGYFEVIEDSVKINSQESIKAEIRFTSTDPKVIMTVDKPVIYVYPEETMKVNIQLNTIGDLNFTYPIYNEGWNFTATPSGNISMNEKEYNYLFWESKMPEKLLQEIDGTGFLVEKENLLSFLESSLSKMGLNSKEQADFITYWYPQMMQNEKNFIHFLINEDCNAYAELKITPQPQTIIRIGMIWSEATSEIIPQPQIIPEMKREGFTVIEWGGVKLDRERL